MNEASSRVPAASTPVIIGVAQRTWRERDRDRTPLDALEEVANAALADCGSERIRGAIDAITHIPSLLTQLPDLAPLMPRNLGAALGERLAIDAVQYSAVAGGNLPQELVNRLAERVVAGEHRAVLLCGVELLNTFLGSLRSGEAAPDWSTGRDDEPLLLSEISDALSAPSELAHGLFEPIVSYPLFESALRHAKGLDGAEQGRVLGELVSAMSRVAADNPLAWKREFFTPEEVLSTANRNRMICHPYTKLMNAAASVDMAASVVLTTAATARELGVPPEQWMYLWAGADTHDGWVLSERETLHTSPALEVAARATLDQAGVGLDDVAHFDLYSCFPSAVQVACDALGLGIDDPRGVTVTGGLSLFGGPGNNYSLHAIAEMASRLRGDPAGLGLVTANGGYLTKHSVGLYSGGAPARAWRPADTAALQAPLDALPQRVLADRADGGLTIDAYTVRYSGDAPQTGIVLGTLDDGRRCLAHTEISETMFAQLLEEDCVGLRGHVTGGEDVNRFRF